MKKMEGSYLMTLIASISMSVVIVVHMMSVLSVKRIKKERGGIY